jgi:hypothetical protein
VGSIETKNYILALKTKRIPFVYIHKGKSSRRILLENIIRLAIGKTCE